jgi:hypothetical protein
MPAYDDTKTIEKVRRMMAENGGMSRRAAILAVAGPDSLRRIEVKMAKEADGQGEDAVERARFHKYWSSKGLERVDGRYTKEAASTMWVAEDGAGRDLSFRVPPSFGGIDRMMLAGHRIEFYHEDDGSVVALWNRSTGKAYVRPRPSHVDVVGMAMFGATGLLMPVAGLLFGWAGIIAALIGTSTLAPGTLWYMKWRGDRELAERNRAMAETC